MPDRMIFVSAAQSDRGWAREFAEVLRRDHGFNVWFDEWSIRPGDLIPEALDRGLRESDLIVLVIGHEAAPQPNLFFEFGAALAMGKRVVPVVPQDYDPSQLPLPLRYRRYLVQRSPQDTAEELVAEIGELHPARV